MICVTIFFWHRAGRVILELILPIKGPEACHALTGAFFHLGKMRSSSR